MTAWAFEARHCPTLLNEIKKTKLQIYISPQAGINILLVAVRSSTLLNNNGILVNRFLVKSQVVDKKFFNLIMNFFNVHRPGLSS